MEQKGIIFGTKITYCAILILKEVKFIMRKKLWDKLPILILNSPHRMSV